MNDVKVTERGWSGHFILGSRCLYTRNTLIEHEAIAIVVSTVGNCQDYHSTGFPNEISIMSIGPNRYFETLVFHADNTKWKDADASRQISVPVNWLLPKEWMEQEAQIMHQENVEYIVEQLKAGNKFPVETYEQ